MEITSRVGIKKCQFIQKRDQIDLVPWWRMVFVIIRTSDFFVLSMKLSLQILLDN